MTINKEKVGQAAITAIVAFIVSVVGMFLFNIGVAAFSGIAAGLSVTVGKEYGDSLSMEESWHWKDALPGALGVIIGLLACLIFYMIRTYEAAA